MSGKQTQTGAFRKKRVYFSQVSNIALRDPNLSLKAKGLYALIQSYITLEEFTLYKSFLMKQCKEGRDSFNSAWNELKASGYLLQYKVIDSKGLISYEYDLVDSPVTENPYTENPVTDKPYTENPYTGKPVSINNTDSNNTNLNNTDINNTTESAEVEPKGSVVNHQENVILEETNIKELTAHQKKIVAEWDIATLIKAIQIYKELNGQYFKLLEKIYKDGAKVSLMSGSKKKDASEGMYSHDWDFDELERLQREHIQKKLKEAGTELPA